MINFCEKMGMYGVSELEDYFLAGILTADPVLMIGTHGSGKTFFAQRMAEVLGLRYHAYDASKAMFEDVLGFPNPKALSEGTISYIPTPMSILDKQYVLVDEISRANPQMQNKWLEVIRSRRIMGVKCPSLLYVWAAMNPLSYDGAVPLDEALAGRFAFILIMPETHNMSDIDALRVILNENSDDAVALSKWGAKNNQLPDMPTEEINAIITTAGAEYVKLAQTRSASISQYVVRLMKVLGSDRAVAANNILLDGRRVGMIRRNILSVLAIKAAKNAHVDLDMLVLEVLLNSLPFPATGKQIDVTKISNAHDVAREALRMRDDVNYHIMMETNMARKLYMAISSEETKPSVVRDIISDITTNEEHLPIVAALMPLILKYPDNFDMDIIGSVTEAIGKVSEDRLIAYKMDKASILGLEDFGAMKSRLMATPMGRMAFRIASQGVAEVTGNTRYYSRGQVTGSDAGVTLDELTNKVKGIYEQLSSARSIFLPLYEAMRDGTFTAQHLDGMDEETIDEPIDDEDSVKESA